MIETGDGLTVYQRYYRRHRAQIAERERLRRMDLNYLNKKRAYGRQWQRNHKEKRLEYVHAWKKKNPDYFRKLVREVRYRVINLLGGKCVICGIIDKRILQINHLNGHGNDDYRRHSPIAFYRSVLSGLRSHDDLDVRCANCNIIYEFEQGRRKE